MVMRRRRTWHAALMFLRPEVFRVLDDIDMLRMVQIKAEWGTGVVDFECNATRKRCGSDRVESIKVIGEGRSFPRVIAFAASDVRKNISVDESEICGI
jgi:hypothetical protein